MAVGAGLSFELAFKLTELLDGYFGYAQGISLLYLPAGVKLLFILIGRIPALVGLTLMASYVAVEEWAGYGLWAPISFAVVAQVNYYLAVYWMVRWLGINQFLTNMRYWHIVVLSLVVSLVNGIILNVVYLWEGVSVPTNFLSRSAAMTLGDFMGCFAVTSLFQLLAAALKNRVPAVER